MLTKTTFLKKRTTIAGKRTTIAGKKKVATVKSTRAAALPRTTRIKRDHLGGLFTFKELMKADEPRRVVLVHAGLQSVIMEEAAAALAVPKATLFGAIGVPVSTMSRRLQSGARLSLDESDKVDRVAQAFKRAIEVFGKEEMAREWMSTRLLALGDCTPLELLDSSAGYQMVLNTIGRIAYGAPA